MSDNEEGIGGSGEGKHGRYTPQQIQRLQGIFNECTHPDVNVRMNLSRELGLFPHQIQFWFQNKRTQIKAQQAKTKAIALQAENDVIRHENFAITEALMHKVCSSCRVHIPVGEFTCIDKEKLRAENAQLKEELQRVTSEVEKYTGRPISQLHLSNPLQLSSSDTSLTSPRHQGMTNGLSLDFAGKTISQNKATLD